MKKQKPLIGAEQPAKDRKRPDPAPPARRNGEEGHSRRISPGQNPCPESEKRPDPAPPTRRLIRNKQIVWRTLQNLAERLDDLVSNGFGLVVDHPIKVLVAHTQLLIQPIFGFPLRPQQGQHIQTQHAFFQSPEGEMTEQETSEALAILSSFRVEE